MHKKTAVLLIGFGGPRKLEEVRPFLAHVLEGTRISPERVEEVYHHYELIGGVSPYIENTHKQAVDLQNWLMVQNIKIPVAVGYRHSFPFFKDIFFEFKKKGIERVIGFVLAGFRSYASFEKYIEHVETGRKEADAENIEILYTDEFYLDPLFIEAQAKLIPQAPKTFYIFSAHSIPEEMSNKSDYAGQFLRSAEAVAQRLNLAHWTIAYQSRSGNFRDAWLEPSIESVIGKIDPNGFTDICVIPIGFLCENVEILFDLDIEAKKACETRRFQYRRASPVNNHPLFIEMMGRLVLDAIPEISSRGLQR